MALAGEIAKYIGNEIVKVGGKDLATKTATSALSELAPKVVTKVGTDLATNAGTKMATGSVLSSLVPSVRANWNNTGDIEGMLDGKFLGTNDNYFPSVFSEGALGRATYGADQPMDQRKVAGLVRAIKNNEDIAPIAGFKNNDGLIDIYDGHHRLAAYRKAGKMPRVKLFDSSSKEDAYNYADKWAKNAVKKSGVGSDVAKRAEGYLGGRMLDKTGKPITFYHSTPYEFSKFDDTKLGQNTGYTNTALGHFVTTDKDFSKRFIDIDNVGKTGKTMELQAKVSKPIIHPYVAGQKYPQEQLDDILKNWIRAISDNEETANEIIQDYVNAANETRELMESSGQVYDTKSPLWDEYMNQTFMDNDPYEYSAQDREALLRNGYDAVEIVEGPKSGLVEGSNDDSIVSSYAVLSGDNLVPVRHIPVQQDNYVPLYHQTSANSLADFSLDKRSAGVSDATMPEGIFLKETDADIGLPGKNQLQLDAKLNNPLRVLNRDDLKAKLIAMNPKVAKYLRAENDIDNLYEKLSEEAQTAVDKAYEKMYYDKSDANKKAFAEAIEKMNGIIPEWREKIRENAAASQKEIKKLLKENGYDGMIMDEDRGSFGRKVKSYLVLDKEQLRDNSIPVKRKLSSNFSAK